MKKIFFILILIFNCNLSYSNTDIVYLDVQFIIDNSEIGIFYKKKIKVLQDKNKSKLNIKEAEIKIKETEFNNQKNILKEDELKKKLKELNNLLKNYKNNQNELNKLINLEKKKYTTKILGILNPMITKYVEENKIKLVIDKKNILVGIRTLDITNNILELLNNHTEDENLLNEN